MVVTNIFLDEAAKAFNTESFIVPSHLAVGTSLITADPAATSLDGEVGTRVESDSVRTNNIVTFSGIRSGTNILSPSGETITSCALFSAITSGSLMTLATLPGLTQTTNFDVEVSWDISFERDT